MHKLAVEMAVRQAASEGKAVVKLQCQLLGVRRPGAALVRRNLSEPFGKECFFTNATPGRRWAKATPGRRTPRS